MAYPRVVSWLMISCENASTKKAILKQRPPLACGDIHCAPSSFAYWSMTLESSMWGRNTPCTSRQLYYSIMKSLKIGRVKFAGIDLEWNYAATHKDRTCRLSIKNYIQDLLIRVGHPMPSKKQLSPHKHRGIVYGAKEQYAHVKSSSPSLDEKGV